MCHPGFCLGLSLPTQVSTSTVGPGARRMKQWMLMRKRPRASMKCGASQSRCRSTASGAASGRTQVGRVGPYHSTTFSTRIRPISTGCTVRSVRRLDVFGSGQRAEEVEQHPVEGVRLVEVRGVAGVLDHLEASAGDLL